MSDIAWRGFAMIDGMGLTVLTDHAAIRAVLEPRLSADPVRNTLLGTIGLTLEPSAWLATGARGLAVRSGSEHPLLVTGTWSAAERSELVAHLCALPGLAGLSGPDRLVRELAGAVFDPPARFIPQRLYRCDELAVPPAVPGLATTASDRHRTVVRRWFAAFVAEAHDHLRSTDAAADSAVAEGHAWLWLTPDGEPVSMALRRPVLAGSARIGPVYTPPEHRGHGYGSAVTAAATASIRADGAIPVLFTDLGNPTSNKIYAALGFVPVEDRLAASRA